MKNITITSDNIKSHSKRISVCTQNANVRYSKQFLQKTINTWQPHCPYPLSLEDAREIAENATNLIIFLKELDEKYG